MIAYNKYRGVLKINTEKSAQAISHALYQPARMARSGGEGKGVCNQKNQPSLRVQRSSFLELPYIFTFLLMLFAMFSKGQENPHLLPYHDFVVYDSNYIHFYNDSTNFNTFFGKLDTLIFKGKGKINIMQIGGSHVQADVWSDQMRTNFQKFSPNLNGGRGFLFPYHLAQTNNPYYYNVTYTGVWEGFRNSVANHHSKWGVAGITASTKDSVATFKLVFRGDKTPYYDFNSVKIFHDIDSTSYCITLLSDTCTLIRINREIGYTEFLFDTYQDSIEFLIYKEGTLSSSFFNLYGISLDNDDPGIVYTSIGVNGARTKSYLKCEQFTQHLKAINPDLVIFCIGINDAYEPDFCENCFENNYDTLVAWTRKVNPAAEFLFVTNSDSYYNKRHPNQRALLVRDVMIKLSKKYNGGMWDMFNVMGGLGSIKTWQNNNFAKRDKIHLTKEGYILIGDLMFSAIIKEYDKHLKLKIEN